MVAADKDVVILRTFSKIYGMRVCARAPRLARRTFSANSAGSARHDADHGHGRRQRESRAKYLIPKGVS